MHEIRIFLILSVFGSLRFPAQEGFFSQVGQIVPKLFDVFGSNVGRRVNYGISCPSHSGSEGIGANKTSNLWSRVMIGRRRSSLSSGDSIE